MIFSVEWNLKSKFCHTYFSVGDEEDFKFSFAFPPIAIWIWVEGVVPYKLLPRDADRITGIKVHHGKIWFHIWDNSFHWSSCQPKWRNFTFDPADFFLGRSKYSERDIETVRVNVPMPEGDYPATVRLYQAVWKRPRWPFAQKIHRADIELDKPIPIPGKGENSWDLDEDAIFSLTTPAKTPQEAVDALVRSAMKTREKYGWDLEKGVAQ